MGVGLGWVCPDPVFCCRFSFGSGRLVHPFGCSVLCFFCLVGWLFVQSFSFCFGLLWPCLSMGLWMITADRVMTDLADFISSIHYSGGGVDSPNHGGYRTTIRLVADVYKTCWSLCRIGVFMVEMTVFLASWCSGDLCSFVSDWTREVMFGPVGSTFCYK